jgi:drug/metabolite transporter (DMT)-like permease
MESSAKSRHGTAVVLLLATALMWSLGGVLIKSVEWPSMAKSGARSAIGSVVLLLWLRRPEFTWRPAQVGAALAYCATVTLFVIANDRTTAANTIFLQYTGPIYVALLSPWVLGERPRRGDWLCIGIALVGIALFFRDQFSPRGLSGIICALGSGMAYGTMIVLLRKERDASPASALLLGNWITAAIGLPFAIGHPLPADQAVMIGVLGVVQLGLPYLLFSIAIQRVTALEAVLLPMLEPILNPLWVALARGEWPGPWSLAGGSLVLGAVAVRGWMAALQRDQPPIQTATAGKKSMPSTTHS